MSGNISKSRRGEILCNLNGSSDNFKYFESIFFKHLYFRVSNSSEHAATVGKSLLHDVKIA